VNRILYALIFLVSTQFLVACSEKIAHPSENYNTGVNASHSVYIDGGILKVLSENQQDILFIYIRPAVTGRWIPTGGGGGTQDKPWLFKSSASWTLGDENGDRSSDSPQKSYSMVFDSRNMTLTTDTGTYAVRRGSIIVIYLNSDWRTQTVKSGIESLRKFDLPEEDKQQLVNKVRKHYTGN